MASGTIFNISRYAIHDGPGIRTTVFFKGCPLSCWWCHNPESISRAPQLALRPTRCIRCGKCVEACPNDAILWRDDAPVTDFALCRLCLACTTVCCADAREVLGRTMAVDEVMAEVSKDVPFYDESGGGVTFSGGEPLMQPAFLMALLEACGQLDIHRAVDTSGYADGETLLQVAESTDLFLYDLKHMDTEVHRRYTGAGNELILENLKRLAEAGANVCVRLPIIPGVNDDLPNAENMGAFLHTLRRIDMVEVLPYHDVMLSKYRRFGWIYRLGQVPPLDPARMREIVEVLSRYGLRVTIGGNHYESAHQ